MSLKVCRKFKKEEGMINLDLLTGSALTVSKLDKLIDDSAKLGKPMYSGCTDELNMYLSETKESVDEAYHRYLRKKDGIFDNLKSKIIARSGSTIILYSRITSIENRFRLDLKPSYKCTFETEDDARMWMIKRGIHRGQFYKHSKSGKLYEFLGESKSSENPDEEFVIYRALYGEGTIWTRPKSMFFEDVEINEEIVPRFRRMKLSEIIEELRNENEINIINK